MGKKNLVFNEVDTKVDFPDMEKKLLKNWYESGIVKAYLEKNKNSKKTFSFLDGPITANNPMGIHHAWGRTYKDIWQRYKNMQGFRQRFQNGFDCQGLWVEVEVEKELGLKSKKDIENLVGGDFKKSIAKFVDLCKKRVYKYADIQSEQSKRLGYFMDWDNSYYTLSDENNYMIWHFLKKCHEKNLIYKGKDSVPWCPRCGTAISQHEILTEDYRELTHEAVFVTFPVDGKKDESILIWTTTPWTLPANVACAVDPQISYVYAKGKGNQKLIMSEVAAKSLGLTILKKVKGEKLIGLTYSSAFDHLPRVKEAFGKYKHKVVSSDERILPVSDAEGTGIVHIATGAGSEDFALGKKEELPVLAVIDEQADYLEGLGEFSGKNAKTNPQLIINYLKEKGYLYKEEKFKHKYPVCWRCKTELVWRVVDEWYIAIDPVREDMKKITRKINWIPSFGLKRELDWLNNMHDWLISKKRYWGLALPIWECTSCGEFEVIGGKEELEKRAEKGWDDFERHSPHRPWVDDVKIKCKKCGELTSRIPDVGSPWLDAGIVPYSTLTKENKGKPMYLSDKTEWRKWFPADFITESFPGQFKNWFYALIAESAVLENEEPYKTVMGYATLFGEDGKAMHKSLGNSIEFNEGADRIGVDVMRWMYSKQSYADNLLFGFNKADETRRAFHLKLWNIYNFFVTYANLDEWAPVGKAKLPQNSKLSILDKWILARMSETVSQVTQLLEAYDAYTASSQIEEFVNDLSNWYIRRSRSRVGIAAKDKSDKQVFYKVTYYLLTTLCKILVPFNPFITDAIYSNLVKDESIHLQDWPKSKKLAAHEKRLIYDMDKIREVVEKAHSLRKLKEVPVRQPLSSLKVTSTHSVAFKVLLELIEDELNVKRVDWKKGKLLRVSLDTKLTKELKEEGDTRELIRQIQNERRKIGVKLIDRVEVVVPWMPKDKKLVDLVLQKTLATKLTKGKFKVKVTS